MEENRPKINWKHFCPEFIMVLTAGAAIYWHGFLCAAEMQMLLRNMVMGALGILMVGFMLRQDYVCSRLDYDNAEHLWCFWGAFGCSIILAFVSVYLPFGAWPYLPVYILLSLFSNMSVGVVSASVLLMLSVLLGGADIGIFFLYFVSGVFSASLFRHLKQDFPVGVPWFLSMLCLFMCETANIVLTANEQLESELFFIPVANVVISSIMLVAVLHLFSGAVIYKDRGNYLELNNPENAILAACKKEDKEAYMLCVHTAYFCERISNSLGLEADAVKCAGYYHRMEKDYEELMEANHFPPAVRAILTEYHTRKSAVEHKETAVLVCSEAVIRSMMRILSQKNTSDEDYDQIINLVFKKLQDSGVFRNCNITMQELHIIQKIFKEEKLYYDFLR